MICAVGARVRTVFGDGDGKAGEDGSGGSYGEDDGEQGRGHDERR